MTTEDERLQEARDRRRRQDEQMALPVKAACECVYRMGVRDADGRLVEGLEGWGGLDVDPQCPKHGVRAAAAHRLTREEEAQLREDMGEFPV